MKTLEQSKNSIDWLYANLKSHFEHDGDLLEGVQMSFDKAREMHKDEIIKAFDEGQEYEYQYHINSTPKFDSETYYNETFSDESNN
jgi:hypothetical protein